MVNNVEHLFICLFAICVFSLGKYLVLSQKRKTFKIGMCYFYIEICIVSVDNLVLRKEMLFKQNFYFLFAKTEALILILTPVKIFLWTTKKIGFRHNS